MALPPLAPIARPGAWNESCVSGNLARTLRRWLAPDCRPLPEVTLSDLMSHNNIRSEGVAGRNGEWKIPGNGLTIALWES